MKIMLLGANGQVGSEVCEAFADEKLFSLSALCSKELDLRDEKSLKSKFKENPPDIVINCAAYTDVEGCESNKNTALEVNGIVPGNLGKLCSFYNSFLIHLSTDYVFDGKKADLYSENDLCNPVNFYGQSKLIGEKNIQKTCKKFVILRVSWVFGKNGKNFLKTMIDLSEREEIHVISDQSSFPTSAKSIADILKKIVKIYSKDQSFDYGVYNYRNGPITTWYEFAKKIFLAAEKIGSIKNTPKIIPITSEDYISNVQRPFNSALSINKINTSLNLKETAWGQELEEVLGSMFKEYK